MKDIRERPAYTKKMLAFNDVSRINPLALRNVQTGHAPFNRDIHFAHAHSFCRAICQITSPLRQKQIQVRHFVLFTNKEKPTSHVHYAVIA